MLLDRTGDDARRYTLPTRAIILWIVPLLVVGALPFLLGRGDLSRDDGPTAARPPEPRGAAPAALPPSGPAVVATATATSATGGPSATFTGQPPVAATSQPGGSAATAVSQPTAVVASPLGGTAAGASSAPTATVAAALPTAPPATRFPAPTVGNGTAQVGQAGAASGALRVATGGESVRLRKGPGLQSDVVGLLADGSEVTALGAQRAEGGRRWQEVRTATGLRGWVDSALLGTASPTSTRRAN
jgi:hypothetical protein